MSVPVNLYVDRMSPVEPVRVADVYSVTHERSTIYAEAASKMGMSTKDYAEFRQALTDGAAVYVVLPRHIDAMAGVHRRNGQVYVLRNVVVPSGTMGWRVNLADGTSVMIPQICGNLSMSRGQAIAHRPKVIAARPQPHKVRAVAYVAPKVPVAPTPVTFAAPAPVVEPVAVAPVAAVAGVASHASALPFLGLLAPVIGSIAGGGGGSHITTPVESVPVPPCSGGSNLMGACHP